MHFEFAQTCFYWKGLLCRVTFIILWLGVQPWGSVLALNPGVTHSSWVSGAGTPGTHCLEPGPSAQLSSSHHSAGSEQYFTLDLTVHTVMGSWVDSWDAVCCDSTNGPLSSCTTLYCTALWWKRGPVGERDPCGPDSPIAAGQFVLYIFYYIKSVFRVASFKGLAFPRYTWATGWATLM